MCVSVWVATNLQCLQSELWTWHEWEGQTQHVWMPCARSFVGWSWRQHVSWQPVTTSEWAVHIHCTLYTVQTLTSILSEKRKMDRGSPLLPALPGVPMSKTSRRRMNDLWALSTVAGQPSTSLSTSNMCIWPSVLRLSSLMCLHTKMVHYMIVYNYAMLGNYFKTPRDCTDSWIKANNCAMQINLCDMVAYIHVVFITHTFLATIIMVITLTSWQSWDWPPCSVGQCDQGELCRCVWPGPERGGWCVVFSVLGWWAAQRESDESTPF